MFIESSLPELMVSSMKMVRYIRLDLVGFFLLISRRIRTPSKTLEWKSSLIVKSSKTCCTQINDERGAYLVDCHKSPEENADLLVEGDHVHRVGQVGQLGVDYVLEKLTYPRV